MNIFVTHSFPEVAASSLRYYPKLLNKMPLESVQLLAMAVEEHQRPHTKAGHRMRHTPAQFKHPCAVWVRENPLHYSWLMQYTKVLLKFRRELFKESRVEQMIEELPEPTVEWIHEKLEFVNCTPYKDLPVFEAYLQYLWINKAFLRVTQFFV